VLTKGVAERVEELADRVEGFVPKGAQRFVRVLPLSEVIALFLGKDVFSADVQRRYWKIVSGFKNEMEILLNAQKEQLIKVSGEEIAELILKNREGMLEVAPGYDGVYGKPKLGSVQNPKQEERSAERKERFLRRTGNLEGYIDQGR
jgi:PHP family Zn ribbon phosphoesterase